MRSSCDCIRDAAEGVRRSNPSHSLLYPSQVCCIPAGVCGSLLPPLQAPFWQQQYHSQVSAEQQQRSSWQAATTTTLSQAAAVTITSQQAQAGLPLSSLQWYVLLGVCLPCTRCRAQHAARRPWHSIGNLTCTRASRAAAALRCCLAVSNSLSLALIILQAACKGKVFLESTNRIVLCTGLVTGQLEAEQ